MTDEQVAVSFVVLTYRQLEAKPRLIGVLNVCSCLSFIPTLLSLTENYLNLEYACS